MLSVALLVMQMAPAQDSTNPALASTGPAAKAPVTRSASDGAIITRRDARTITLKIPAPRGMIVDREGEPMAQNQVAYQVALQYPQFENADRGFVINWARARLAALAPVMANITVFSDDELFDHYRHRRWLPLLVTGQIGEKEARDLESKLTSGLVLHPVYRRYYPHGEVAAHILGYTGSVGRLPTGPINFNEPLWEESEGRAGLEKLFDSELAGEPGMKKLLFDESGNKLLEEQVKRPRPGGTLVTSLNLKWQLLAEKTLREGCKRGAFVVLDAVTGEVLVMASRPSFDLNRFIPGISEVEFKALNEDPATPLYGRAFQSAYPPASSYKPVVALAALNNGVVTEDSTIYCPAAITIGNHTFNNWTKTPEGDINVKRAIARSCNTWFYQVGIRTGPSVFLGLSRRLGFGERSGLPLIGETPGLVPSDDWMLKHEKRRILDGDTANLSIGQGSLLASPLQVAQAMAGIANGGALPKLHLIRQVQDSRGRVVKAPIPERKNWLGVDPHAVEVVRAGMADTVNEGGGTGRSAGLSYTKLCGKTGTAQWGPKSKNQRLAWFAGFLPEDNPRYSFAVLYEGRPNEKVSGGRMAAPMVKKFFEGIKDDIKDTIAPPQKALVVIDESAGVVAPVAEIVSEDGEPASEGYSRPPGNDVPLRALPVEPLDNDFEDPADDHEAGQPAPAPRAIRAIPVETDEVIENGVEEP
ncbi:MAG: penicillin-binding transpeptidase domain-containing protein [Akkermansiaceae bacterium]|nr:penicillin-binding transpeptidase domain-containing protein [Akkermansiaceae bacterium]